MADHTIKLGLGESLDIVLPDGRAVSVVLSNMEDEQEFPELDIMLPGIAAVNCFGESLNPARSGAGHGGHIRLAKQLIIPIEPSINQGA
jgi:hypothetical protein